MRILIVLFLFVNSTVFAQNQAKQTPVEVKFYGFANPQSDDLELVPAYRQITSKNESADEEALEIIKRAKMQLKLQSLQNAVQGEELGKATRSGGPTTPVLEVGYNALNSQGIPPDNSIAVNRNNQIVACVNSSVRYYNATSGAGLVSSIALANFFAPMTNPSLASSNLCDPKAYYDQIADRFILFAQTCDGNSSTSQIVFAFSKTNNPTQGWFFYGFSGNQQAAIGQTGWFDYPKLGVSNHDVFVTGNIFDNSMDYIESAIFQIDKTKCFAGSPLVSGDAIIHTSLDFNPFTIVPISSGSTGGYGNNMYFISTSNTGFSGNNTFLNIYEITNIVQSSPSVVAKNLDVSNAPSPAEAIQKGTNTRLKVGDNRGQDGFFLHGRMHYVFHGDVDGQGYASVVYYRLKPNGSNWMVDKQVNIKATNKDFSFPSICSMGYLNDVNDHSALIGFTYASSNEFPGMKAVFINNEGTASSLIEVKTGTGYADPYNDGSITRWGDYSGMSRVYNASKPTAWFFGCYGNTTHDWTNHFAKITSPQWPFSTNDLTNEQEKITMYPNPIREEIVSVDLDLVESGKLVISLTDLSGRFIKKVLEIKTNKGNNNLKFNAGGLPSGNYLVNFQLNGKTIKNEKISVLGK
jgi:hypothetical protein